MPHIILDYSPNLDTAMDMEALCVTLRDAAVATGVFPTAGIRVRAHRAEQAVIADGDARHGYIDITMRIGAGRSDTAKTQVVDALFDAAKAFTAKYMAAHPFMLSLDLTEADPELSRKTSSIRQFLPPDLH